MSKPSSIDSSALLSPFARQVLELYASELADVRFPGLDLEALRALAGEVHEAQEEVDRLEAETRDARERVTERSAALQGQAERALAYARIYAEGNEKLSEAIATIRRQPGKETPSAAPKKRGRPRKDDAQLEVLEAAAE